MDNSKPRSDQERFYGRRKGRPLNPSRAKALELLDDIEIPKDRVEEKAHIDPKSLFNKPVTRICLEIGFGNGDMLADLHQKETNTGFIGAEPFINGVAAFLKNIKDDNNDNIRVWPDDVRLLLNALNDNSIDRVMVLNPDPWPKTRHHKRRIINPDNLDMLARIMKPGASLLMTTDIDDLAEWMATQTVNHPDFKWNTKTPSDALTPPADWEPTRYELKGQDAGRNQYYLAAERR